MTVTFERFAMRRGTAASASTRNPILAAGEEGYETDTGQRKVGDGTTAWNDLPYNTLTPAQAADFAPVTGAFGALAAAPYGVVGDCNNSGATITILSGSLSQGSLSSTPTDLKVGHTLVIDGLGNLIVQSINHGLNLVTFTAPASSATSIKHFIYGTDNTTPINNWLSDCRTFRLAGIIHGGKFLVTGAVGRLDGPTTGYAGLTIYCAGAATNTGRQADMAAAGGTSFIWGGAATGPMWQWNRVDNVRWVGGVAMVGQPSYDPSGTFTPFANRCQVLYEVTQNGTPWTGTGHHHFDHLVVEDAALGFQFGESSGDNNCDTSTWSRLIANRCDQVGLFNNQQSIAHHFDWVHFISCPRGIVTNGGHLSFGQINLSLCDGTGAGTYSLELNGTTGGVGCYIGLIRTENNSANAILVNGAQVCKVGVFHDEGAAGSSYGKQLVSVGANGAGPGVLDIDDAYLSSFSATTPPVAMTSGAGRTGIVKIGHLQATGPSGDIVLKNLFSIDANSIIDLTVDKLTDFNQKHYNPINTKLMRGRCMTYGTTVNASGLVNMAFLNDNATANVFGYSARIPLGYSILNLNVICARSDGAFSIFRRQYQLSKATAGGAITVISTTTVGADVVTGTDQLNAVTFTNPGNIVKVIVGGTSGITGAWQATISLDAWTQGLDN